MPKFFESYNCHSSHRAILGGELRRYGWFLWICSDCDGGYSQSSTGYSGFLEDHENKPCVLSATSPVIKTRGIGFPRGKMRCSFKVGTLRSIYHVRHELGPGSCVIVDLSPTLETYETWVPEEMKPCSCGGGVK